MEIAIYGGTFDPIHTGHTMIASYVASTPGVDSVWLMVSPSNPWKQGRQMAPEHLRLEWARQAVRSLPGVEVSDFEFTLPRPSYTCDTLARLTEAYPGHRFRVLIGADNWRDFAGWRQARRIITRHGVIVYPRPGIDLPPGFSPIEDCDLANVTILSGHTPESHASSTAIRRALSRGLPAPPGMLDPAVEQSILATGYYVSHRP